MTPEDRIGRLIADSQKGHYEPYNGPSEDDILAVVRAAVAAERESFVRLVGAEADAVLGVAGHDYKAAKAVAVLAGRLARRVRGGPTA